MTWSKILLKRKVVEALRNKKYYLQTVHKLGKPKIMYKIEKQKDLLQISQLTVECNDMLSETSSQDYFNCNDLLRYLEAIEKVMFPSQ